MRGFVRTLGSAKAVRARSGSAASKSASRDPDLGQRAGHVDAVQQLLDPREQPLPSLGLAVAAEAEHVGDLGVLARRDVVRGPGRRHELLGHRGVVAENVRQEDGVGPAVSNAEARAHRMGERMVDADEGVGEREPRDRCRVRHRRARVDVAAVRVGAWQRVEDQVGGLDAEGIGEGRGEDGDAGLQRVGQRVDAGVGGDLGRQGQRQRAGRRPPCPGRASSPRASTCVPPGDARPRARPPSRCRPSSGRRPAAPDGRVRRGSGPPACGRPGTAASARRA